MIENVLKFCWEDQFPFPLVRYVIIQGKLSSLFSAALTWGASFFRSAYGGKIRKKIRGSPPLG